MKKEEEGRKEEEKKGNGQAQWLTQIPATQASEIGRLAVQGQPKQKVSEPPSQPTTGHGGACLAIPAT